MMPNRAATFRQADVARAIKGAKAAGFEVGSVRITQTGEIVLQPKAHADAETDDPVERWEAEYRARQT